MAFSWIQPSFAGGEIGPSLYGRIDMSKYQVALRKCDNFIVRQYGGVENRPGTRFVGEAKYSNKNAALSHSSFQLSRPTRWSSVKDTCASSKMAPMCSTAAM